MIKLTKEPLETSLEHNMIRPYETTTYLVQTLYQMFKERKVAYINLWKAYEEGYPKVYTEVSKEFDTDSYLQPIVFVAFDFSREDDSNLTVLCDNGRKAMCYRDSLSSSPLFYEKAIPMMIDMIYNHDNWVIHYDDAMIEKFNSDKKKYWKEDGHLHTPFELYVGGVYAADKFCKNPPNYAERYKYNCYRWVGGHLSYEDWLRYGNKFPNRGSGMKTTGLLDRIRGFFKRLFH